MAGIHLWESYNLINTVHTSVKKIVKEDLMYIYVSVWQKSSRAYRKSQSTKQKSTKAFKIHLQIINGKMQHNE